MLKKKQQIIWVPESTNFMQINVCIYIPLWNFEQVIEPVVLRIVCDSHWKICSYRMLICIWYIHHSVYPKLMVILNVTLMVILYLILIQITLKRGRYINIKCYNDQKLWLNYSNCSNCLLLIIENGRHGQGWIN